MTQHVETYEDFRIAVPTDYENVFSHFYFAQNRTKQTITKTLLPSYQTMLIFSFGEKALLKSKNNRQVPSKMRKEDWFTIINYCGYHDQSHLIKDFKHYLNLSPTKYLSIQQDICNPTT